MDKLQRPDGPKEWSPTSWLRSTLLSPEEIRRTRKIRKEAKEHKPASVEDTLWMTELVRRLSEIGPSDYVFPDYMALINNADGSAFSMGFVREFPISRTTVIDPIEKPSTTIEVLEFTAQLRPNQAVLAVRPYFRVNGASAPDVIARLQGMELGVSIDAVEVLRGPPTPYLIAQDRTFFGKTRQSFRVRRNDPLFPACRLNGMLADHSQPEGIFCVSGTQIRMTLGGRFNFGRIDCSIGVVAGLYSVDYGEISVSSPGRIGLI